MMKTKTLIWPLVAVVCLTGGSFLATHTPTWKAARVWAEGPTSAETAKPTGTVATSAVEPASELSRAFRAVHHAMEGAVVNIDTSRKAVANPHGGLPKDLRDMLPPDLQDLPENGGGGSGRARPLGTGSGVIVSADGYILTNNHVVEDADEISAKLNDGRELKAKVVGRDPKTDLAVIKIDADKLTYAKFGDSDALEVGDWVLAFGSPFGFDQTMTQGIISAKGRQVPIIAMHNKALAGLTYENFLQTDAAINPGNSGGPLVNLKGEVVGINSAIASNNGAYNGIGFSIPSNDAKYIMDQLIKNGKVVRGYMGVEIGDVREATVRPQARSVGYTGTTGVFVSAVTAGSPGEKGGLKAGDVITSINGQKVESLQQLRNIVARTQPGMPVDLKVFRNRKEVPVSFALGEQPETRLPIAQGGRPEKAPVASDFNALGVTVAEQGGKVVVTDVDPRGLGADQGLRKGDTILSVLGKEVKSAADLNTAIKEWKPAQGLWMSVRSKDGTERFIYVERE